MQCRAGLDDDLARVPDVRTARETGRGPPVPGVQRVRVDDVDVESTHEARDACDRDGPPERVARPLADPVAGGDPLHRHDVHRHARGLELGAQRRVARHDHVTLELVGWQAAKHAEECMIGAAALGDGLD